MPLPATELVVTKNYEELVMFTTVALSWLWPQGSGPEYVIESYQVLVTSQPDTRLYWTDIVSSEVNFSNVSLEYNMEYTISVISLNCAGKSSPISIFNIMYGKLSMTRA